MPFYGSKAEVLLPPSKSIILVTSTPQHNTLICCCSPPPTRHPPPPKQKVCLIPFYGNKAEVLLPPSKQMAYVFPPMHPPNPTP
jgi:hypothetical protein